MQFPLYVPSAYRRCTLSLSAHAHSRRARCYTVQPTEVSYRDEQTRVVQMDHPP